MSSFISKPAETNLNETSSDEEDSLTYADAPEEPMNDILFTAPNDPISVLNEEYRAQLSPNFNHDHCNISESSRKSLVEALAEKDAGNACFRVNDYDGAIFHYSRAIDLCPGSGFADGKSPNEEVSTVAQSPMDETVVVDSDIETASVLYGNRSAAFLAMGELELALEDCSYSLEKNPNYLKVLHRRCMLYEKLDKLDEALTGRNSMFFQFFPGLVDHSFNHTFFDASHTLYSLSNLTFLDWKKIESIDKEFPKVKANM